MNPDKVADHEVANRDAHKRTWPPWVRVHRIIPAALTGTWGSSQWPVAKLVLRRTLTEKSKLAHAGWFN